MKVQKHRVVSLGGWGSIEQLVESGEKFRVVSWDGKCSEKSADGGGRGGGFGVQGSTLGGGNSGLFRRRRKEFYKTMLVLHWASKLTLSFQNNSSHT